MPQFRRGRIFLVLVAVACGRQTFDLLPSDPILIESDGGGMENAGGQLVAGASSDPAAATGGADGGDSNPNPPSDGGSPERAGSGGTPDWGPTAGRPPDDHCERPITECPAASPSCDPCNPEQPDPNYDCRNWLTPLCHPTFRHCVQCVPPNGSNPGSNNCHPGEVCEFETATCRPVCGGPNPPCPSHLPHCNLFDQNFGICMQCTAPEHCRSPSGPMQCSMGTCVQCTHNLHCKVNPGAPVCDDYKCRPCGNDCECGVDFWCDRETGRCNPR